MKASITSLELNCVHEPRGCPWGRDWVQTKTCFSGRGMQALLFYKCRTSSSRLRLMGHAGLRTNLDARLAADAIHWVFKAHNHGSVIGKSIPIIPIVVI